MHLSQSMTNRRAKQDHITYIHLDMNLLTFLAKADWTSFRNFISKICFRTVLQLNFSKTKKNLNQNSKLSKRQNVDSDLRFQFCSGFERGR